MRQAAEALPDWLVARPPMPRDPETLSAFDALYRVALTATGGFIDYRLAAPKWQFLCHVADTEPVLLHGSGNPAIAEFEPRKADDVIAFGDRKAVYAASDGLWPFYYAILDRHAHPMTLINTSLKVIGEDGQRSPPYYYFSITETALHARAFRAGTIYFLPRSGFDQQAPLRIGPWSVELPQWASLTPVTPLAKLSVTPADFPLLDALRGHDGATVFARARKNPDGFPWLQDSPATSDR